MSNASELAPNKTRDVAIVLDWQAYFYAFLEEHGEYVVTADEERILFADGWQYHINDGYQGPEVPPPESPKELRELQGYYWNTRWDQLLQERDALLKRIRMLEDWQAARAIPMKVRIQYQYWDDKEGVLREKLGDPEDLNTDGLRRNLDDVEYKLREAAVAFREFQPKTEEG